MTAYPKSAGIYKLTCLDNKKIYIGKAVNIYNRLNHHKSNGNQLKGRCYFENSLIKHGWDSFSVEILETFKDFDKKRDKHILFEREAHYIKLFDSTNHNIGYNICKYSNDRTGIPVSKETKEKLKQAHIGRIVSEKTKEKMRQSALGKPKSEETKEKIRQANLGNHHSESTKEKMRQSKLGKKFSEERKEKLRNNKTSDETKEKIRQSRLGKHHSEATKEKMRQVKLGKHHSEETKEKIRQTKLRNSLRIKKIDNKTLIIDKYVHGNQV